MRASDLEDEPSAPAIVPAVRRPPKHPAELTPHPHPEPRCASLCARAGLCLAVAAGSHPSDLGCRIQTNKKDLASTLRPAPGCPQTLMYAELSLVTTGQSPKIRGAEINQRLLHALCQTLRGGLVLFLERQGALQLFQLSCCGCKPGD